MGNTIYEKSVKELFKDLLDELGVSRGNTITRKHIQDWFHQKYPLIKNGTVSAHLVLFTTNSASRINHNVDASGKHDLFYQTDRSSFRAYRPREDPKPIYRLTTAAGKKIETTYGEKSVAKPLEVLAKEIVLNLEELLGKLDPKAGRDLFQWIKDLEQQNIIPAPVVDRMHTIRRFETAWSTQRIISTNMIGRYWNPPGCL
jgi:hypothetical protein